MTSDIAPLKPKSADSIETYLDDPARWAPRLDRILHEQETRYASLELLAQGQAKLIADGDAAKLLEVLAQREELIRQLQESSDELAPFRHKWAELMKAIEPTKRGAFTDRIDGITRTIERVNESDEVDRVAMDARRVEVAERLNEVSRCKSALSAYGRPRTGPRFQDREG